MPRPILLFLHLLGAMAWVGGMFFAYFCLRPAAAEVLEPPQRLKLWVGVFSRFLPMVAAMVLVILATGFSLMAQTGFKNAPAGWHVMLALGLVMAAVFAYIYAVLFPRLRRHSAAANWPAAAQSLNHIRRLVAFNLALGMGTVAAALAAR
jgi:uncharacterized membrane protein